MEEKLIKKIDIALFEEGEIYIEQDEKTFPQETLFCLYCKEPISDSEEYVHAEDEDIYYHKECYNLLHEDEDDEEEID